MENNAKTVLLAEDDLALLDVLRLKLKHAGFVVLSARNVEEAVDILSKNKIDLIWTDHYLLGKQSGLDLVAQVRANPAWKNIPVIVVSQTSTDETLLKYQKFGIEKFYTKMNTNLDEVVEFIKSMFQVIAQRQQ